MKIGIDLTPLQGPHRMRGIGSVIINFLNNIPDKEKKQHEFVFYLYESETTKEDPAQYIQAEGLTYRTEYIKENDKAVYTGKLRYISKFINNQFKLWELRYGDSRIQRDQLAGLNAFIQFDPATPLPKSKHGLQKILFVHDLIPYILESDYLFGYRTARNKKYSRRASLRLLLRRNNYIKSIRAICRHADKIIANSHHTKQDFVKILKIKPNKITVCYLGVSRVSHTTLKTTEFNYYKETGWGPILNNIDLADKKFMLFVGGVDPRRKLVDFVAAFNNLRGQGCDIKLVLAGDTMFGATKVPNTDLKKYLKHTSYIDDIYFLGFVDEQQRNWLYENAIVFVYPSVYEGFGLPILEAMVHGTPVITYKNSSISEVGGQAVIYAKDYIDILNQTKQLLDNPALRQERAAQSMQQAERFSWTKTSQNIIKTMF